MSTTPITKPQDLETPILDRLNKLRNIGAVYLAFNFVQFLLFLWFVEMTKGRVKRRFARLEEEGSMVKLA